MTNFGGKPIGGVVPLQGADYPQLLVFAYGSKHIALVHADTGAVEYEADLPLAATSSVGFSGGSAFIAGAISDTGRDGAWLATADGYVFFDRATRSLTTTYALVTSELAENLGGDTGHDLLFAANYTPSIQLVDLAAQRSYYLDGAAFTAAFPSGPGSTSTALSEPDAGSVDTGLRIGHRHQRGQRRRRLHQPEDDRQDRCRRRQVDLRSRHRRHGAAQARQPDPERLGGAVEVIKNLSNSKAYGYLVDGGAHKSFQIDTSAVLAAPAAGTTGSDQHRDDGASAAVTAAVKSINW